LALLTFRGIGIRALAATVPANRINNLTFSPHFSREESIDVVAKTGIHERRFAPSGMCASDLAAASAKSLLDREAIDPQAIGAVIFVSQSPDYKMPATSILLQDRLGLGTDVMAFDLSLGCSGFVYGLSVAYALIQSGMEKSVLLLNGETRSRAYSLKERQVAYLFGDAGSAALISRGDQFGESMFSLHSDGSRADYIRTEAGGARIPSSPETLQERLIDSFGNLRSQEQGSMKGADVFGFVLGCIPSHIRDFVEESGFSMEDIDRFFLHQANGFMNNHILRKLGVPESRAPMCLDRFGNTSSVSIPLTMVANRGDWWPQDKRILLSGFGVGMSWASAIVQTGHLHVLPLVDL
jgi:3-oxoacyl-[acyl-carrier-protein] synthase III